MAKGDVFLTGQTALWLWRNAWKVIMDGSRPTHQTDLATSIRCLGDLDAILSEEPAAVCDVVNRLPRPLHVLVPDDAHRPRANGVACQMWSFGFPMGSIWRFGRHVHVVSPAFLALLLAEKATPIELAMLINEMCGTYAYARLNDDGFVTRPQIARLADITALCAAMTGAHGVKRLRAASGWAFDRARSPMEVEVAMRLSLPPRHGGYGVPRPELNARITLTGRAASIAGQRHAELDLYWADESGKTNGLDVEYLGEKWHSQRMGADVRRRDALGDMGIGVIEVFKGQIAGTDSFDPIARAVRKRLGMRPPAKSEKVRLRRRELHEEFARIRWLGEAVTTR